MHLIEIFEGVCNNFKEYAETENAAGQRSVTRTNARNGKTLSLKNIKINSQTTKDLKHKVLAYLKPVFLIVVIGFKKRFHGVSCYIKYDTIKSHRVFFCSFWGVF